ncbi:MAG TPA: hypothetical protein VFE53_16130 [Mucilaginibacter sp.]|jgi:hypothetical protein|nr:hypothetical protein [Mucilaginibacter sp.]
MQRRVFVKLSAFTAAVLTLPFVPGCKPAAPDAESQPVFFSHLADAKTIAETGKAYIATHSDENNVDKLKKILLPQKGIPADQDTISRSLAGRIANDFNMGNTATVNGWVLAATEARQCALFYLLQL